MQINKIIILGGGSAGWMTAAGLSSQLSHIDVTLIESSDISTIGVGESTLGEINAFLRMLDIKEEDWMAACHATYKMSIDFTNWDGKETRFHYPFGFYPNFVQEGPLNKKDHWFHRKVLCENVPPTEFAEFLWDTIEIIDNNKFTKNEDEFFRNFLTTGTSSDVAYHMDASLFGEWLKNEYCKPKGVEHIVGTFAEAHQTETGEIDYITLKGSDKKYHADLFVDCTGFHSVLTNKVLNVSDISFSSLLINDRALATTIPYTDKNIEMETTTNATTMNAGWCWNIPLYNRIGTGYVYSSQFLTEDEAEKEFREYLLKHRLPFANKEPLRDISRIKIKSGVKKEAWTKNVVAVGLNCGFIEPLESTGLLFTHNTIRDLVRAIKLGKYGKNVTGYIRQSFNTWIHEFMSLASFVIFHYAFAQRNDTAYWKYISNEINYTGKDSQLSQLKGLDELKSMMATYSFLNNGFRGIPEPEGISTIMAGMDFDPMHKYDIEDHMKTNNIPEIRDYLYNLDDWLDEKRQRNLKKVNTLPTHYEYLKENIYNGEE